MVSLSLKLIKIALPGGGDGGSGWISKIYTCGEQSFYRFSGILLIIHGQPSQAQNCTPWYHFSGCIQKDSPAAELFLQFFWYYILKLPYLGTFGGEMSKKIACGGLFCSRFSHLRNSAPSAPKSWHVAHNHYLIIHCFEWYCVWKEAMVICYYLT